ncbi:hypothetical protein BRYFOR_05425 [Marvinbryantia formatexigens DSM 14469]|uniref:Uncharacterized protein n=1 Tax=Marvinbryantia formatexigens DSM 14469 TaxID=478749 RepID=C6L9Y3_9FIRM|nr:hypothetical protein [Marvinbryantia formatexigens]EET62390.1 hypothetical protein BRYFOR_05425 [Marvinbryantia formatexigens DSM 14469]UWO25066.1 hypothetical protein NQ534_00775 [Marvinbryantia formatexigens DSM 14469]SDG29361.1 hypothetical protein SAMN05660368_02296 [Marvinbryantia formatexigens]
MAAKFEFYLSEEDFDRLYEIKRERGKSDMSGNEFAKELLEKEIHRLHPGIVGDE